MRPLRLGVMPWCCESSLSVLLFLLLLVVLQWEVSVVEASSSSLIGSENITLFHNNNPHEEDVMPYRPYNDSVSFRRFQSRTSRNNNSRRSVNDNPDDVVSCGACCFDILPLRGSTFVSSTSPYREALLKNRYYVKLINVAGIPLVASYNVRDAAMFETALLLVKMTVKNPQLLRNLKEEEIHFAVIGKDEKITDLPSYDNLDPDQWDYARGVGATRWRPVSSCAEEDVLCLSDAVYVNENICVHEHSHTLQGSGGKLDTPRMIEFNGREQNLDTLLKEVYNDRIIDIDSAGRPSFLWENTYASTNHEEMWAEGVQSYFNVNREGPMGGDGVHNHIWSRSLLEDYHIELHQVIEAVFSSDVNLDCPGTSMDQCDCNQIRQMCQQVGVANNNNNTPPPTRPPTKLPTKPPTRHPTTKPTPRPTIPFPTPKPPTNIPFPTPKPSPSPSRQWPSSAPSTDDRIPAMALQASGGASERRGGSKWECRITLALLAVSFLLW